MRIFILFVFTYLCFGCINNETTISYAALSEHLQDINIEFSKIDENSILLKYTLYDSILCSKLFDKKTIYSAEKSIFDSKIDFVKQVDSSHLSQMQDDVDLLHVWYELYKLEHHRNLWDYRLNLDCFNSILELCKIKFEYIDNEEILYAVSNLLIKKHNASLEKSNPILYSMKKEWNLLSDRYKNKLMYCEFGKKNEEGNVCNCSSRKNYTLLFNSQLVNYINMQNEMSKHIYICHDFPYKYKGSICHDYNVFYEYSFLETSEGWLNIKGQIISNPMTDLI